MFLNYALALHELDFVLVSLFFHYKILYFCIFDLEAYTMLLALKTTITSLFLPNILH